MTDATVTDDQRLESWCSSCGARPGALCMTGAGKVKNAPHTSRGKQHSRSTGVGISRTTRVALVRRAGGWCEVCPKIDPGAPQHPGEDAHHVLMRSQGGTNDLDNLLLACRRGHDLVHMQPARAYELGLLERSSR